MEFLVINEVSINPDMPQERKSELVASELTQGRKLQDEGVIKRIWRVPGRWAVIAIYEADDIDSLPAKAVFLYLHAPAGAP